MKDVTIRILFQRSDGSVDDGQHECDLSNFGGIVPAIGDRILNPGVPTGLDRSDAKNREMWTVVGRVFNPKDNEDYIALIVETHAPAKGELSLLPGG